jgi:hypothetical protein
MLLFEPQEFTLDQGGGNRRDTSRTDGIYCSVWILPMCEFGMFSHLDQGWFSWKSEREASNRIFGQEGRFVNNFPMLDHTMRDNGLHLKRQGWRF